MDVFTLLALAAGLSMDAFAVAVCKGLALRELTMDMGSCFHRSDHLLPLHGGSKGGQRLWDKV